MRVRDDESTTRRAKAVTIERWEDANPSWVVIALHAIITTALDGKVLDEIEVQAQHRKTGEVVNGVGADVSMALAMITHRLRARR
jgi:hypothetical protein